MRSAIECLNKIASRTDRVILFHSGTGKDSIALLDLCYPRFREVVCVYMYMVEGLEHIDKYIVWAKRKYAGVRFIQVPHYALTQYIKDGAFGCAQDASQKIKSLSDITEDIRAETGIDWAIYGFKQTDSLNRRIMLRTYDGETINEKTKKAYPLSKLTNKDVEAYIRHKRLIPPLKYGGGQSQGSDVSNIPFLAFCREYYPQDLEMVIAKFPKVEKVLFDYMNYDEKYEQED